MRIIPILLLSAFLVVPVSAAKGSAALDFHRLIEATESKIQDEILNPLLGSGRAHVFVTAEFEAEIHRNSSERFGRGEVQKNKIKKFSGSLKIEGNDPPGAEDKRTQISKQTKLIKESSLRVGSKRVGFAVRILHDRDISVEKLKEIKKTLVWAFPGELKAKDIEFRAARFFP